MQLFDRSTELQMGPFLLRQACRDCLDVGVETIPDTSEIHPLKLTKLIQE